MNLSAKRPRSCTAFMDIVHDEALLQFSWDDQGSVLLALHVYGSQGECVADSSAPLPDDGITILDKDGTELLDVSANLDEPIRYRLYNRTGQLVTVSEGARTQVFGGLKMESKPAPWASDSRTG